jgi:hypothetical protein
MVAATRLATLKATDAADEMLPAASLAHTEAVWLPVDSAPVFQPDVHAVWTPLSILHRFDAASAGLVKETFAEPAVPVADWITWPEVGALIVGGPGGVTSAKLALTLCAWSMVTEQPADPEQSPPHAVKLWPLVPAPAVTVTGVPSAYVQLQLEEHVFEPVPDTEPEPLTVMCRM